MAMLNSVRNAGLGDREFSVVWLHPLAAPTIIVACGPRRISAAMSTIYDSDMFEPLAIGNWTLKAEKSDERRTKSTSGAAGAGVACRISSANVTAPSAMIVRMYQRA